MPKILDTLDVIQNLSTIYESDKAFQILKDFERVIDELGLYVYDNWEIGELVEGPAVSRHWVTCTFMWPRKKMPDPDGGKRLVDYDCKVSYEKSYTVKAREIKKPDDIRPGTKKGKLDKIPIWLVKIKMPKKLILDIYGGDVETYEYEDPKQTQASAPAPAAPGGDVMSPDAAAPVDAGPDTGAVV